MIEPNPQDREPSLGKQGRAYVSLIDGNLMLNIHERSIFDLSVQDGEDMIAALRQAIDGAARRTREACPHANVDSCSSGARWCHDCQANLPD